MLGTIFTIWLILMILGGIGKAIEGANRSAANRHKRQSILDAQYERLHSRKDDYE